MVVGCGFLYREDYDMDFPDDVMAEITLVQSRLNNTILNVFQYNVANVPVGVSAAHIAEAWWNHVKTTWRAIMASNFGAYFMTVRVRELNNPTGAFADWNVPTGEQTGTRAPTAAPQSLPLFNAAGVRLLVGSRLTRPGQKRFYGLTETDSDEGALAAAYVTLLTAHMNGLVSLMTLGAPAATVTLEPIVTRKDASGTVINSQPVIGYLIAQQITSQTTRKAGRGI